jgi:putative transposase
MSRANPLWGAPRIHGELLKLGIRVAQRTVAKYMLPHPPRSTSQTWTSFLRNHLGQTVSVDFFVVPTLRFHVLYVFLVLSHTRRQVLHFNITYAPSARWTAQQLREAFPFTSPPKYLLRDRDGIYGLEFQHVAQTLEFGELRIAPRSPWQSPYVERLIGSVRRECLDHVIVLNDSHLPSSKTTLRIITIGARTWDWTKMLPNSEGFSCPTRARSWPSRKWGASIIATSAEPPDLMALLRAVVAERGRD